MTDLSLIKIKTMQWVYAVNIPLILFILLVACTKDTADSPPLNSVSKNILIYTSTYPLYEWVSRLTQGSATVKRLLPDTADPAISVPYAETLANAANARLIILNGAQFENWKNQVSLPESRVLDTASVFQGSWLHYKTSVSHSHGPEGKHSHEGVDGHTWLDPLNAQAQLESIYLRLKQDQLESNDVLKKRYQTIFLELSTVHQGWTELATQLKEVPLIAAHPAYNYLASRYQLDIQSLDIDPSKSLTTQSLDEVTQACSHQRSKLSRKSAPCIILWESDALPTTINQLKEREIYSLVIRPVESSPPEGKYADAVLTDQQNSRSLLKSIHTRDAPTPTTQVPSVSQ